ncbi:MAG: tetratricopeptide repeat protein [Candidatus Thorarchaeota archaeon]|nr:MAG: tetratricopeptide repeat protein [Candidatus Thorarchaeota archaeon]
MSGSDSSDVGLAHRLWEEGREHRSQGDYSRAIACLTTALALDKKNAQIWADMARVWLELNSVEDAWYAVTTALMHDPENEDAKRIFGLVQGRM